MKDEIVEVKKGVVNTWEGDQLEVEGGAYLTPVAWLRNEAELERLRAKMAELEERSLLVPGLLVGAAVLGGLVGWWLASDDE